MFSIARSEVFNVSHKGKDNGGRAIRAVGDLSFL